MMFVLYATDDVEPDRLLASVIMVSPGRWPSYVMCDPDAARTGLEAARAIMACCSDAAPAAAVYSLCEHADGMPLPARPAAIVSGSSACYADGMRPSSGPVRFLLRALEHHAGMI